MISAAALISTYGYAAITIGTFFEGETILILGGFAAHQGYLALPWVVVCGFAGTLCGDQFYFHLGRIKGTTVLEKRPHWRARAARVFALLHKHQSLLTLGFRFLYGLRTITPFVLGAGGIPPVRFLVFNMIGGLLWATAITVAGYLFGHVFELFIGNLKRYELRLFLVLAALGAVVWCVHWYGNRK